MNSRGQVRIGGIQSAILKSCLVASTLFMLSFSGQVFAQSDDASGILHTAQVGGEELNLISIKFDNAVQADDHALIRNELAKYPGIKSVDFSSLNDYVYIKYTNDTNANQLLAVLDKLNKRGHYLDHGNPVYYQKNSSVYFVR